TAENASSSFDLQAVIRSTDDLPVVEGTVDSLYEYGADGPDSSINGIEWKDAEYNEQDGTYTNVNHVGTFTGKYNGEYSFKLSREARDTFEVDNTEDLVFTYLVKDADGDTAEADVIISLSGEPNEVEAYYARIVVDNSEVVEGDSLTYTVELVNANGDLVTLPQCSDVTVHLELNGDAANDTDTMNRPSSIVIAGGQSSASFVVETVDDNIVEPVEELTVQIQEIDSDYLGNNIHPALGDGGQA